MKRFYNDNEIYGMYRRIKGTSNKKRLVIVSELTLLSIPELIGLLESWGEQLENEKNRLVATRTA